MGIHRFYGSSLASRASLGLGAAASRRRHRRWSRRSRRRREPPAEQKDDAAARGASVALRAGWADLRSSGGARARDFARSQTHQGARARRQGRGGAGDVGLVPRLDLQGRHSRLSPVETAGFVSGSDLDAINQAILGVQDPVARGLWTCLFDSFQFPSLTRQTEFDATLIYSFTGALARIVARVSGRQEEQGGGAISNRSRKQQCRV